MSLDKRGLKAEDYIIKHFTYKGEKLEKSSFKDDYRKDIDAYHPTLGKVSIKSQSDKYFNIALEIRQYNSKNLSSFIQGWFDYGEADTYLIALRNDKEGGRIHTIYLADKLTLKQWVDSKIITDTYCHYAMKLNKGRQYDLPVVKLVPINQLLKDKILYKTFRR